MPYSVFFGVNSDRVSDARLLDVLDDIASTFDESPQTMLCLLGEPLEGVTWFTFVCSAFRRDAAMAAGFFRDVMGLAGIDFVVHEQDDFLLSDFVFRHYHNQQIDLVVRSNGGEVAVTTGAIDPEIPREGNAVIMGLRALGWSTRPLWEKIGTTSRMVVLRKERVKPERLVIEPRTKTSPKLPPVKVIRGSSEIGFSYWREHATERFPLKAVAAIPKKDEILSLQVFVGKPGVWPDLKHVERIKGRLSVVDSYDPARPDPSAYGLREVDLGAVREMKYPTTFYVQGATERIVGKHLEAADSMEFRGAGAQHIEMPKLAKLRYGTITLGGCGELVLPVLREVKRLSLHLRPGPVKVVLPHLELGELVLQLERLDATTVLDIPRLARKNVRIEAGNPDLVERVRALLKR